MRILRGIWLARFTAAAVLLALAGCEPALSSPPSTQPETSPSTAPATQNESPSKSEVRIIRPFDGILVRVQDDNNSAVEIKALTCLDSGLLEQIACSPQTREHESLVVIKVKPSQIHAALLMAGFEPGAPGKWIYENEQFRTIPPKGEKLDISVRYADPGDPSKHIERDIREWIRPSVDTVTALQQKQREFPKAPWIFAGSEIVPNTLHMGPGEHYVADMSGSIIGLVTFGDEVIGFSDVLADQESVQALIWEANSDTVPPPNTPVTVVLRRWQSDAPTK